MTKPYKPKHNLLPPEAVVLDREYALTINMSYSDSEPEHYINCGYVCIFKDLSQYGDFKMYKEFSKSYRQHYHGVIIFRKYSDILDFYRYLSLNTRRLAVELDTIGSYHWSIYIQKQRHMNYCTTLDKVKACNGKLDAITNEFYTKHTNRGQIKSILD